MKILFRGFFFIVLLTNFTLLFAENIQKNNFIKIKLEDIPKFSRVLNIEGLNKIKGANSYNKNIITSYFTMVLDTPGKIIKNQNNGVELSEKIHSSPRGGRMENEIPEFHEEQANLFWLIVLKMYIENAHEFTKKDKNEPVFLTIHLHRGKSAISHMTLLKKIFVEFFNVPISSIQQKSINDIPVLQFKLLKEKIYVTVQGDKRHAHKVYMPSNYPCDIFLAFGFVGALDPNLSSGDIIIPVSSFDFDLNTLTINMEKETKGNNHLIKVLPQFIEKYQTPSAINFCNNVLFSPFKERKKASLYKMEDIHFLKILSVQDAFFLPSLLQQKCGENFEKNCITLKKH